MRRLLLVIFTSGVCFAEVFSFGVKGGIPITDALNAAGGTFPKAFTTYVTHTNRYVVGGTVELHLPLRFSIEADALYRRLGYNSSSSGVDSITNAQTVTNSWEFPILGKFEILPGPIRPFIEAGIAFQHLTGINQTIQTFIPPSTTVTSSTSNPLELNDSTTEGFVAGGGIAFKFGPVRISPEVRYIRWGNDAFRDPIHGILTTNRNQGDFLLGITF